MYSSTPHLAAMHISPYDVHISPCTCTYIIKQPCIYHDVTCTYHHVLQACIPMRFIPCTWFNSRSLSFNKITSSFFFLSRDQCLHPLIYRSHPTWHREESPAHTSGHLAHTLRASHTLTSITRYPPGTHLQGFRHTPPSISKLPRTSETHTPGIPILPGHRRLTPPTVLLLSQFIFTFISILTWYLMQQLSNVSTSIWCHITCHMSLHMQHNQPLKTFYHMEQFHLFLKIQQISDEKQIALLWS